MSAKLFLLLTVSVSSLFSQNIKIGDISISEALAKEYFLDCYKRPDTVFYNCQPASDEKFKYAISWLRNPFYPNPKNEPVVLPITKANRIERRYPNWKYMYLLIPREPSAADFRDWFLRRAKVKKK